MQEQETNSIQAAPGNSQPSLIAPAPQPVISAPSEETSDKPDEQIGIRGYLRMLRIIISFALFGLRVFVNSRDWLGRKREKTAAQRHEEGAILREKFLKLGPTFIKTGQTLATRADLLPIEYIQELAALHDEVPPFPAEIARQIVESELHVKIDDVFKSFEDQPIAAASLGQVHRGRLRTGQTVAIKIQRPNLAARIEFDLRVLRRIARFAARYPDLIRGVDWQGTIDEFRAHIYEEMDYRAEVRNAEVFRRNFEKWPAVYVPHIYDIFSTRRVIVMEFIEGFKVTDVDALKAAGRDPHEIVKLLARTYLKQLLEDGFFHADPHPGNLRVMLNGRLAFFDFGMVGRLPVELQSQLISAFFHIVERDVPGLVDDMVRLGFIELSPEEEARFKPIIEGLFDRYLSLKLRDVKFKELLFDLAHVIYEFPFRIPASFTYIVRAMMTLEGIGTQVDPNFNFFEVARPYAKRFMFMREGRYLRSRLVNQLVRGEEGNIEWGKVWKLAKMAFKYYVRGEHKL